ncbi:hypothetical protein CAPTEDRAFT_200045 [Capitella teleta]|uniref:Mediator of RNA polymerase II transcription subunit 25 n=1 Tax=Capitella teleta TaxID=283909 RepID=R7UP80_CAPTE|nr:hypothetical protein CAPTEDRAFT_200045 [Capitella teleta]|eukprot:ELU05747.1 hypothetical protein CAPTEDRAFT_200045 [Capitella teleta]
MWVIIVLSCESYYPDPPASPASLLLALQPLLGGHNIFCLLPSVPSWWLSSTDVVTRLPPPSSSAGSSRSFFASLCCVPVIDFSMVVIENNAPTPTTYDVVFVVESSANVGAYFETLKSSYILPAIEHFNGGPPEAVDYGCNYSCSLYTLVTYCADDHAPGLAASCSSPTTSAQEFIQRLDNIEFSGGYGDLSYQIAEGLSTALQVFDDVNQLREPNVNAQKHCVLISNSTPVQVPCQENIKFAGLLPDQLLTNLAEIGVNFSIISPRKIPLLFKLFEKASGDLNSMKNFAVDSRHLVLLQGFHLQERPTSPEQSKTEVSMDLKSIIPIVSTTSQLTTPAGVSLMSSLVKGGSPGTMPAPSPQQQDTTLDGGFKPPGSLPLSAAAPMPPSPASLPTASTPGGSIVTASSSGPPVPSASQLQNSMQRQPSGKTGHSSAHEIASQILNAVRSGAQSSMGGGHQPQGNPGQQQPPQPSQAPTSASPGFPFPMSTVSQTGMGQTQSMPQNSVPNSASPAIMSTGLNPQQQPGGHEVPLPDLSSVQPQQARRVIWSGSLEWQDKAKSAQGLDTKFTRSLPCHMSLNQTDPDLNAGKWPTKLIMQLLPSALLAPLQTLFRKSRNVSFDFSSGDVEPLKNLHSLMNKGFAGCVYFPNVQGCEIKVLMLLYSNRKRQFMGLIPNDQTGFLNAIRTLIAKTKGRVGNQLNTGEVAMRSQMGMHQCCSLA